MYTINFDEQQNWVSQSKLHDYGNNTLKKLCEDRVSYLQL